MEKAKKIKIILGIIYFLIVSIFLWYFFTNFSMDEVTSYEFIKKNRDLLSTFKELETFSKIPDVFPLILVPQIGLFFLFIIICTLVDLTYFYQLIKFNS